MTTAPRIKVPDTIRAGDVIEVRAVVRHPMQRGQRKDAQGNDVPRNIIHTFTATFAGAPVLEADFGTGISSDPFIAFYVKVERSGVLELTWIDDRGQTISASETLTVSEA